MATWKKYSYICDSDTCDALVEITSKAEPKFTWCGACGKPLNTLVSVEDTGIK
jgi:hypothetical protein